jgi:CRP/FNR family transcriptional regulator, cyclic AMP receptor protein
MDTDRLRSIQLFADIPDEDLVQIAPFADEISVEEGKRLVNEGDFAHQFMAIEEGSAEVLRGGEHVADLGPGDFFGEVGLLEKDRRNASVVAKSPMRLITLTGWDLKRLEKAMPKAAEQIRKVMEERRAE